MSEQGYNPNQEPGNNLNLSAAGWNKVTSAVDEMSNGVPRGIRLTPQQKTTRETGRLVTEAEATEDIDVGDWLNIVGVNIDSDANENYFKYGGCLPKVEKLDPNTDGKTLAVALQPIKSGKYGRICLMGVCVAKVEFESASSFEFYDDEDFTAAGAVKGTSTDTGKKIHWHDVAAATSMAFVSVNMGGGGGGGVMIPVDLVQVGGAQGDSENMPSWTYDVFPADERGNSPDALLTAVDPTTAPHQWRRHLGQMESATHGYAYKNVDGDVEIGWINEILIAAICEEEETP